jgi:hypothetical protein
MLTVDTVCMRRLLLGALLAAPLTAQYVPDSGNGFTAPLKTDEGRGAGARRTNPAASPAHSHAGPASGGGQEREAERHRLLRASIEALPEAELRRILHDASLRDAATADSILGAAPLASGAEVGYPSEDNFLCSRTYGKDSYPLPCKPARDQWEWAFRDKFGITAWWGPAAKWVNGTADLTDIKTYRDAHFNMLDGGPSLQCNGDPNATGPMGSPDQSFDCLARVLAELGPLGLKLVLGWGDDITPVVYSANKSSGMRGLSRVLGGVAGMGGVTDSGPSSWSVTTPEVAWLVGELEKRNLADDVAQIFFHDDEIGDSAATANSVRWLRENANHIAPQSNTFSDSAPESLYVDGQFMFSPEQYAIRGNGKAFTHTMGNAKAAAIMTTEQLLMFANDQLLTERYRLDMWPLFALGDGGSVVDTRSDSLVRVQIYSALAYGARGLIYYCWHGGVWNSTNLKVNFEPLSNYMVAKKTNADATVWGTLLLHARHCGAVRQPAGPEARRHHVVSPSAGGVVQTMDDQLLVGVFSDGLTNDTGYLMVVDLRTNMTTGSVPPRSVGLEINPACQASIVAGHHEGWAQQPSFVEEQLVTLQLHGGAGALLRVTNGKGDVDCGQLLRGVRQWWYDPRTINLAHNYPETSLKAATYGGSMWMPQGYDPGMERDATGQGYGRGWCNQRPCLPGRFRFFHQPGGLAGANSNFIIGGSQWQGGAAAVWRSDAEAKAWSDAAFLLVSFGAESGAALADGLDFATAHGMFALFTPQSSSASAASAAVLSTSLLQELADNYSCHTNFAGFVLASNFSSAATDTKALSATADRMRSVAYWQLPLVLGVGSVAAAAGVGDAGIPFPAIVLPNPSVFPSAAKWSASVVAALAPLGAAARNRSAAMTPAVQLDPCLASDSLIRFAAYGSVLLGAQALWWEGMACARVGSPQFELVAGINRRTAQWAEPLFMRKLYIEKGPWMETDADDNEQMPAHRATRGVDVDPAPAPDIAAALGNSVPHTVPPFGPTDYVLDAVWSTSALTLPPLNGANGTLVHAVAPGGDAGALVQAMDKDLIVAHFRNASADGQNGTSYCMTAQTVQGQDCITYDAVLWIFSTELSLDRGGAPVRQLNVSLRGDIWTTHPVEPDAYQGFTTDCNLGWLGPFIPLRLPGGGVQVVSYSLGPLPKAGANARHASRHEGVPVMKLDDTDSRGRDEPVELASRHWLRPGRGARSGRSDCAAVIAKAYYAVDDTDNIVGATPAMAKFAAGRGARSAPPDTMHFNTAHANIAATARLALKSFWSPLLNDTLTTASEAGLAFAADPANGYRFLQVEGYCDASNATVRPCVDARGNCTAADRRTRELAQYWSDANNDSFLVQTGGQDHWGIAQGAHYVRRWTECYVHAPPPPDCRDGTECGGTGEWTAWPDEPPSVASTNPGTIPWPKSTDMLGWEFLSGANPGYGGGNWLASQPPTPYAHSADTWYPAWAADGNLYTSWTDGLVYDDGTGRTVGSSSGNANGMGTTTTGHAVIVGDDPFALTITNVSAFSSAPFPYLGRYPAGQLVYNGTWFYGTYYLDNPNATVGGNYVGPSPGPDCGNWCVMGPTADFRSSTDSGFSWDEPRLNASGASDNLFGESAQGNGKIKFGAPHWVDFGQELEHSPDGKAYLVGHGASLPGAVQAWMLGDEVYMARVSPTTADMSDRAKWEFYAGGVGKDAKWVAGDASQAEPLVAWRNHTGVVTMSYFAPLKTGRNR